MGTNQSPGSGLLSVHNFSIAMSHKNTIFAKNI